MPWFKVDDMFHTNRKVLRIRRNQRLRAIGLWTLAGSWSSTNLTDGHIPDYMLDELGGDDKTADILVQVGLWERRDDGYHFHKWDTRNPTRSTVLQRRADDAKRKAEARQRKRREQTTSTAESDRTLRGLPSGLPKDSTRSPLYPTRPDP